MCINVLYLVKAKQVRKYYIALEPMLNSVLGFSIAEIASTLCSLRELILIQPSRMNDQNL